MATQVDLNLHGKLADTCETAQCCILYGVFVLVAETQGSAVKLDDSLAASRPERLEHLESLSI